MTDIRGFKRICAACATRYYDFNKSPIICPKCKVEFTGVVKIRTRRGKAVVDDVKAKPTDDEVIDKVEEDDTTVSLTDLEDEEKGDDDEDEEAAGDLDLDDLDEDGDEDDEDLEDLDEDIEIEEKE